MDFSRRELSVLLASAGAAGAQGAAAGLPSKVYAYGELPVKANGANRGRAVLRGATHAGFAVELHLTELGPHAAPHAPHSHVHEEMVMLRTGRLEVTIAGTTATYGPGSVIYVASGDDHGWKNAGVERAEYFVIALGSDA